VRGPATARAMQFDRTIKFYSSPTIHDAPQAWKQALNGAAESYGTILASKGEVPQNIQDAYNVWRAMRDVPAMRDQAMTDANSRLFFEAADWAMHNPRKGDTPQDPKAALFMAAQIMEKKAKGELPEFNPARKDINSAIATNLNKWGFFHSDTATVDASVQGTISSSAKLYYYANRGDWDEAVAAASKDYADTHTMINGRPLYTNFAGAPPDFGAMVNDRLDYATRSLGALPSNGVTSPQDLFLQPVGADDLPANQAAWVIMKQGDTHFGPLVDKTGKPVVITMDDVNYARDSQARAHQAQVLEDHRQAQNRRSLPPDPGPPALAAATFKATRAEELRGRQRPEVPRHARAGAQPVRQKAVVVSTRT
jgi:hypothetical protein